jgi:hypothetical protein
MARLSGKAGIKTAVKTSLRPLARMARPVVETVGLFRARHFSGQTHIHWAQAWDRRLDEALDYLPSVRGCTREQYRELVLPTSVQKLHALATEGGVPTALISLRRRNSYWEPVAYQCLHGVIAPASDTAALGRALNALSIEVRVSAGLGQEACNLNAPLIYSYDAFQIDLQSDYEAYWHRNKKGHLRAVRRARTSCADMTIRVDGEGDMEWIVQNWRLMWERDQAREVVAAEDRLRFWCALQNNGLARDEQFTIHSLQLLADGARVAGAVHIRMGNTAVFQCTARAAEFEQFFVGNRVLDASIEWASSIGCQVFDLGSGDYKKRWGPPGGVQQYGAHFRPKITSIFNKICGD